MTALAEFRQQLQQRLANQQIMVTRWSPGRSANLLQLSTVPKRTVLYVKEFNVSGHPGFWGLTKNQITRLEATQAHWFAVLLMQSAIAGYVISGQQVLHRVNSGNFELGRDGDYKVNEGPDLAAPQRFRTIQDLLARLL